MKVNQLLNYAPRREDVSGEWRRSSTRSYPRH